jgi:hypothetical protein
VPLSEASSSTFRGALWARLRSTLSGGEKEAGALFEGLRDFFRDFFGLVCADDPKKVC